MQKKRRCIHYITSICDGRVDGDFHQKSYDDVSLVIIRIDRNGRLGNSRCCNLCLGLLKDLGVHKVTYSTGIDDDMETIKIRDVPFGSLYDTVGSQVTKEICR